MMNNRRDLTVLSIALVLFFCSCLFAVFAVLFPADFSNDAHHDADEIVDVSEGRILVILVDSFPARFAFSEHMPFLSKFRHQGAWGISKVISLPLTVAGDHAIFAGRFANPFSILDDFSGSDSEYDNLFKRLNNKGKRSVILSSGCLRGAYGKYTDLNVFRPRHFIMSIARFLCLKDGSLSWHY